ncbi:MAG: GDP-mannose 4,6-dehydratase [Candidatus Azambacteria bacterium]|nr:GDP-mannose 4,6-dehydratase [Candidatus Azambacteria bacterium]
MKALVTGGKGFIGSHLVERLLAHGCTIVISLDLEEASCRNIEIFSLYNNFYSIGMDIGMAGIGERILELFKAYKIDTVFHLAGLADVVPSINYPVNYFKANVLGTFNMLEAARRAGEIKKFVYASSSSLYGIPDMKDIPTSESAPIKPQYPYAETKYQGERWVSHFSQIYRLPAISLRLFNVYGPRSRTTGTYGAVFGTFLSQKINGKPFTVVGDGRQSRDFVFVTDVCDAFIKAAESPFSGEIFNVGSEKPQTILRLAELLEGQIVHIPKRPGEPDVTFANISKIQNMLNWTPKVSFEEGVKIMLDNIDYWKDAPVWTPDTIGEATKDWFKFLGKKEAANDNQ